MDMEILRKATWDVVGSNMIAELQGRGTRFILRLGGMVGGLR